MVRPERPSPDSYDDNEQIAPHFSKTPSLTAIPEGHRYNTTDPEKPTGRIVPQVLRHLTALYRKHGLTICRRRGLYWAGSQQEVNDRCRVKTMVLVIELNEQDIDKWWKIDDDARELLRKFDLSGRHGVCLRYYKYEVHDTGVGTIVDGSRGTGARTRVVVVDRPQHSPLTPSPREVGVGMNGPATHTQGTYTDG